MTLVNTSPRVGSYEKPLQLPPPSVLGKRHHRAVEPGGVNIPFVYIAFVSHSSLQ